MKQSESGASLYNGGHADAGELKRHIEKLQTKLWEMQNNVDHISKEHQVLVGGQVEGEGARIGCETDSPLCLTPWWG